LSWLSLAGCAAAEPASVSPADGIFIDLIIRVKNLRIIFSLRGLSFPPSFPGLSGGDKLGFPVGQNCFQPGLGVCRQA